MVSAEDFHGFSGTSVYNTGSGLSRLRLVAHLAYASYSDAGKVE